MSGRDKVVVFIEGAAGAGGGSVERDVLAERGYELVLPPRCATDDDVVRAIDGAPAVLNSTYRWGSGLFGRLPGLKVVVQGGVGYDNIDVGAATRAGVVVCNTVGYGTHEVANHAFAMLLALNRKLIPLDRAVRNGTQLPAPEIMPHTGRLAGQTLGLISFGAIARAVAKRAGGFEMRVIAFDPYVKPSEAEALGVELVTLPEVLSQCDYVSIHTPLSGATHHLIGASELALMKSSSYLVLTSRGGLVDEAALVEALRENRIAGAGIDVWENEPPDANHPLLKLDNVVATMHMGWYSEVGETVRRQRQAESAADLLDGILPHSVVNTEVLEHVSLKPRSGA
jgi:D-3-phosphoglycerate dehydrogenase / 2-oxoglutarate reductase